MDVNRPITESDTCLPCEGTGLNPLHRNADEMFDIISEMAGYACDCDNDGGCLSCRSESIVKKVEAATK